MDKTKYEREYTAFLENSRNRVRFAKTTDIKQIISTLQSVLRTPNLESDISLAIRRDVLNRFPPKSNASVVVTIVALEKIIAILNDRYDESKAQGFPDRNLEKAIMELDKVYGDLGHLSNEFKKASIDNKLEEIQSEL